MSDRNFEGPDGVYWDSFKPFNLERHLQELLKKTREICYYKHYKNGGEMLKIAEYQATRLTQEIILNYYEQK